MARSRYRDDDDDRPRKRSRRREEEEDEDDEDEIDDEDEDEEDERPRKRSPRRDDDDDDDDRPRRKRKTIKRSKKSSGGGGPLLLILSAVGGFVLLAGGGFAVWFFVFNDTPEKAFADIKDATLKKDYGRIYDRMDKQGQAEFANMPPNPFLKATQSGKTGRELYIEIRKEMDGKLSGFGPNRDEVEQGIKDTKVEKATVDGDNATLTIRGPDGKVADVQMVKQDGRWRTKSRGTSAFKLR